MNEATLGRWPVEIEIPVAWGDMDAFRHVNNTVYLRWFESSRIAYFERIGILETDGVGPILAKISVNYKRIVTYPDVITVSTTVTQFGKTSFITQYQARSIQQSNEVVADGEGIIVMFDYQKQEKVLLQESLKEKILALEAMV
jgi:acyl-CoA thioester hydrolase